MVVSKWLIYVSESACVATERSNSCGIFSGRGNKMQRKFTFQFGKS